MADLHLFGGEKGGVGKSIVCRAVIQYLLDHGLDFVAFDTDRSNPDIWRIYGKVLDCQLGIFSEGERYEDTANAIFNAALKKRTIVNLPAQVLIPIKAWFEANDLLEIAADTGVNFVFWFVSDGGFDSINLLKKTLEYFKDGVRYVVVKNLGKADDWEAFDQDKDLQQLMQKYNTTIIEFPKFIGSVVRNRIDSESLPFNSCRSRKPQSAGDNFKGKNHASIQEAASESPLIIGATEHPDFGVIDRQRVKKFLREAYASFEAVEVFTHC
ncbi:mobilization protein [Nostoc sp. ChiQUE01b]|uniref:mobilization protein n=1 Tax=Nostoc sp. ChiQUE01b TaxID=3075376 RepID=UPI002AD3E9E3|nr:mobilization protein [Nostoc sp. ChiQUE01b]MDZ8260601.1 mobilization protein [Nostoc sp. ChiQUE01b]